MAVTMDKGVSADRAADAIGLAADLASIAEALRGSTVQVRGRGPGGGSGVIWTPDGTIVTNAHVARGADAEVELADGRTFNARLVARDDRLDLAELAVEATDLPAAPVADSDHLRVGQIVLAAGNPLGLVGAVATGIIHAIAPLRHGMRDWVRADIRLLPGNSGGPLADAHGHVIGINSMVAGGLGLAVPSNVVTRFLRNHGRRPQIGITTQPVLVPVNGGPVTGLLVLEVRPGSPAEAAGVAMGDVLVGVAGRLFRGPRDLAALQIEWGDTVRLDLLRAGRLAGVEIVVGAPPEAPQQEAA
jgi:serine protease Do